MRKQPQRTRRALVVITGIHSMEHAAREAVDGRCTTMAGDVAVEVHWSYVAGRIGPAGRNSGGRFTYKVAGRASRRETAERALGEAGLDYRGMSMR